MSKQVSSFTDKEGNFHTGDMRVPELRIFIGLRHHTSDRAVLITYIV
jgi:hypothetical protein